MLLSNCMKFLQTKIISSDSKRTGWFVKTLLNQSLADKAVASLIKEVISKVLREIN